MGANRTIRARAVLCAAVVLGAVAVLPARSEQLVLRMFPWPGSATASPATQITLRGAGPDQIGDVLVVGQFSGVHTGRLAAHSDGRGASFLPDAEFRPGEGVVVTAAAPIEGASGPSAQFLVAIPVQHDVSGSNTVQNADGWRSYWTMPGVYAPNVTVLTPSEDRRSGVLFLTESFGPSGSGPFIVDHTGKLVWFKPLPAGVSSANFHAGAYRGRPVLTWWEGAIASGQGFGEHVIADSSYRELTRVRAGNGYMADLHDLVLNNDRTAYVIAYSWIVANALPLGRVGGGTAVECVIQQIDIPTGLVMFEWHSLDHVGLDESYAPVPSISTQGYDYFHLNSIEVLPHGNLLISARHTSTLYAIDGGTGDVLWRLGGRNSDFDVPSDAHFAFQHDARLLGPNVISLFDNGSGPVQEKTFSSGLHIWLDYRSKTVAMVRRFVHPDNALASSQGNMQTLPGGESLIGWGAQPYVSEYDEEGRLIFHASMSPGNSYRAFRQRWIGRPTQPPAFVVKRAGSAVTAYASWNGDTRTVRWRLLAGPSQKRLSPIVTATRVSFETVLRAQTSAKYFAVQALDARGRVLRTAPPRAA